MEKLAEEERVLESMRSEDVVVGAKDLVILHYLKVVNTC